MLCRRREPAKAGETVLLYYGHMDVVPLQLAAGATLHCKAGKFSHDSIIGRPLGRYVTGVSNRRDDRGPPPRLLVLRPSAELWTHAVPHRTQIIYDTDIAVIVLQLRLRPGSRVVEAGTGSGSLTHSLARAVAPHGTVFTCDFHKGRCLEARGEFRRNRLPPSLVSSNWRDVCITSAAEDLPLPPPGARESDACDSAEQQQQWPEADVESQEAPLPGFGLPPASVDAVFLDVPSPWAAVDNVRRVLRPNGILCTFSPCIEQTQRTAEELRRAPHDFVDIRTVEALSTYMEPVRKRARVEGPAGGSATSVAVERDVLKFRPQAVSKGHSAYLTFARRRLPPADDVAPEDLEEEEAAVERAAAAAMIMGEVEDKDKEEEKQKEEPTPE